METVIIKPDSVCGTQPDDDDTLRLNMYISTDKFQH
jgi:hypothetical protein